MAAAVQRRDLRVGPLLAEGGQGRVYALADRPGVVLKAYRNPLDRPELDRLVAWTEGLPPGLDRPLAAAAWPTEVVVDPAVGEHRAVGLLMPRAPRRFTLRHKDGFAHLATLSYLCADPAQRAAAYGLSLPGPFAPARVGLVYALARVLDAFERATPAVSHGDLSSKNVLWSLQRGPEVFLLDCDNSALICPHEPAVVARRRAMTPNWDDPAVPSGTDPTEWSDRYSLALIFLRVVAAAHYPIQTRQKRGEQLALDVDVPPEVRRADSLDPGAPLWAACQAGLQVSHPEARPPASVWVEALEQLLRQIGGGSVVASVTASLGPWASPADLPVIALPVPAGSSGGGLGGGTDTGADPTVRPVAAEARSTAWAVARKPGPDTVADNADAAATGGGGYWMATHSGRTGTFGPSGFGPDGAVPTAAAVPPVPLRSYLRTFARWWAALHRRAVRALRAGRRQDGVRLAALCAAVDVAITAVTAFVVAMIVSPFLGI